MEPPKSAEEVLLPADHMQTCKGSRQEEGAPAWLCSMNMQVR